MEDHVKEIKIHAFDSSLDAIVLTDLNNIIQYVNNAFLPLWEIGKDEVIGKQIEEFWENREDIARLLKRVNHEEQIINELLALKNNKTTFYARISANLVKDSKGNPIGKMVFIIDITIQKQLERVQDSIFQISEVVNFSPDLGNLYKNIHEIVKGLMPAKNFFIALSDPKSGYITFPYSVDEKDSDNRPIEPGKSMTAYIIRTGKPLLISHREFNEMKSKGMIEQIGTAPEHFLGVPLTTTDQDTIGVMATQSYENGQPYTQEHQDILTFFSTQIARAIERRLDEDRKELMLREIHHRVKNNLNIISSLLDLQARRSSVQKIKEEFRSAQERIHSMAIVHENLYRSKDFALINFASYIKDLAESLQRIHKTEDHKITVAFNLINIYLSIEKAIPCGLIVNELLANALKHAFPANHSKPKEHSIKKKIEIKIERESPTKVQITVKDNGIGLSKKLDISKTTSLGLRVVHLLCRQINGQIIRNQCNGTSFTITFEA